MNEYLRQPCCWLWLGKYFALFLGSCSCYSCTESTVSTERSVDRRVALKHVNKGKTNRFFISEIHFYGIINVLQNFKVNVFQLVFLLLYCLHGEDFSCISPPGRNILFSFKVLPLSNLEKQCFLCV